jgi:5-methylcytosine-specific restriction endonuclease McrA
MALKQTLVAIARKDYKEHSPDLEITDCCPRDLVPQSFWNHERKNRATDKNGLPRDWSKRKILVHGRDKCCKRCGLSLTLDECHIHHITMRGYAGDHALRNLVTLCRSCHSLMPGHYDMRFEHVPTDPGHSKQKKFWPLDIDVYMAKTVPDMVVSAIVQHNVTNKPIS